MESICFCSVTQSCPILWPPGTAACQASQFFTISQSLPKHVHWVGDAIQPSHPLSSPSPPAFNLSQHQGLFKWVSFFASGGQCIRVSASESVIPMNIQDWFPLGWICWISLQSKELSRVLHHHSLKALNLRCSAFFIVQLSHPSGKTIALTIWTFVGKVMGREGTK